MGAARQTDDNVGKDKEAEADEVCVWFYVNGNLGVWGEGYLAKLGPSKIQFFVFKLNLCMDHQTFLCAVEERAMCIFKNFNFLDYFSGVLRKIGPKARSPLLLPFPFFKHLSAGLEARPALRCLKKGKGRRTSSFGGRKCCRIDFLFAAH